MTWYDRAPMPSARAEVGAATLDGRLYIIGGTEQRPGAEPVWATTTVIAFSPRTGEWSDIAPLPAPLTHVGVAASDTRLYAVGGFTAPVHMHPQAVVFEYDPRANAWTPLPDMPHRLGSPATAVVDGKLHVFGGRDSRRTVPLPGLPFEMGFGTVRTHLIFDLEKRTWSATEPIPGESRDHIAAVTDGNRVHLIGGRIDDIDQNLTRHDVYDPRTDTWTTAAPLPAPRSAGAAVALGDGRLLYAGGECSSDGGTFADATIYDPQADRWTAIAPLPHGGRHGFGAARVDGRVFLAGGAPTCGGGATTDLLELRL
ncbi:Kelch repeat-containing protein [Catenuloplanes japonicus]|uniref:Kelch repeat-containing protein n=1 Tax=Catenuloplanes japonicus TaxID=33876 RepID=UPI000ACD1061|nr:kelch repeat-containing protein [Catenuloplanes japonicus]